MDEKLQHMWQEIQKNSIIHDRLVEVTSFMTRWNKEHLQQWSKKSKTDLECVQKEISNSLKYLQTEADLLDEEGFQREIQNTKYFIRNFELANLQEFIQKLRCEDSQRKRSESIMESEQNQVENKQNIVRTCRAQSVQFGSMKMDLRGKISKMESNFSQGVVKHVDRAVKDVVQMKEFVENTLKPNLEGFANPQIDQLLKWLQVRLE
eukprot:TRINITY_DN7572_c0_g2_i3.p1 TRINITY_DN7572_c0_g2~~TRINITY_DN7572_c0_g2_i3.p1  ORF type:complete len:207 (+),score=16.45 TRINITY_DN7572_c0_g2_i3:14-634(+)